MGIRKRTYVLIGRLKNDQGLDLIGLRRAMEKGVSWYGDIS